MEGPPPLVYAIRSNTKSKCSFMPNWCARSHSDCCFFVPCTNILTSGHMIKMGFTSFDPLWPKTPCYMQTSQLSEVRIFVHGTKKQNWSYCRL